MDIIWQVFDRTTQDGRSTRQDSRRVPPAGFEPAHPAPEAGALSPELRGRRGQCISPLRNQIMRRSPESIRSGMDRYSGSSGRRHL